MSFQKIKSVAPGPTREQIASMYNVPMEMSSSFWDELGVPSQWRCSWTSLLRRRFRFDRVASLVNSRLFVLVVALLIVLNGVFIGIVSDFRITAVIQEYHLRGSENQEEFDLPTPPWETYIENFFTCVFALELFLRIMAEELSFFFGLEWSWNLLDVALVIASTTEMVAGLTGGENLANVTFIRLLRLLRLVRTLRSIRILRFLRLFSKFRMLLIAIQHSVVPLTWACFLVFWMLYLASVVFLYGVAEYIGGGGADASQVSELERLFGGLDWTLLTLFMSITGGTSWETAVYAMLEVHLAYGLLFVLFIATMTLAALNMIAGIFVNDAIEMAQMDRDILIQVESERNKAMINEMNGLFTEFDTDGSGTLTRGELTEAWKNPDVSARFRMLGVEELDASTLFETLDVDGAEEIRIHEFVTGCLIAKTLTKPMDTMTFLRETKRTTRMQRDQLAVVEHHINYVAMKLDALEKEARARREETFVPRSKWHRMREERASRADQFNSNPENEEGHCGRVVVFPGLDETVGACQSTPPQHLHLVTELDSPTASEGCTTSMAPLGC